jgi:two-component system OmpR family response regulator
MAGHILMIEDDERLAAMVSDYLGEAGFRVTHHASAEEGLAALKRARFDALILDVMLPDVDGFEVCRCVRATSDIPILMLTARGDATDRVVGLELGADDYLSKPFNPRELLARIKAVLRRSQAQTGRQQTKQGKLGFDRWTLDLSRRELIDEKGVSVPLSSGEFRLLAVLVERPGMVLTRDQLLDLTRGRSAQPFDRSIDNQISRLRKKIERDPRAPDLIKTAWGDGYSFAGEVKEV